GSPAARRNGPRGADWHRSWGQCPRPRREPPANPVPGRRCRARRSSRRRRTPAPRPPVPGRRVPCSSQPPTGTGGVGSGAGAPWSVLRAVRAPARGISPHPPSPRSPVTVQLPTPAESLRMVAVHAHPDDEASNGAGSTARNAREGVQVTVITCTGGERGDVLNPRLRDDPSLTAETLPGIRRQEMARAQEILGVDHEWLGFIDSGLPEGDPLPPLPAGSFATLPVEEAARPLVEAVRRLRPHVMTTYDENGGYPHPDHIQVNRISLAAFDLAADPD